MNNRSLSSAWLASWMSRVSGVLKVMTGQFERQHDFAPLFLGSCGEPDGEGCEGGGHQTREWLGSFPRVVGHTERPSRPWDSAEGAVEIEGGADQ